MGSPTDKLKGKVMTKDAVKYIAGLASGRAIRMAAGAAMYDALALSVARMVAPPIESPASLPKARPIAALNIGKRIPNPKRNRPAFLRSDNLLPVTIPTSSRNKTNIPRNGVSKRGAN